MGVGERAWAQAGTRADALARGAQAASSRRGRHGRAGAGRTRACGRWAHAGARGRRQARGRGAAGERGALPGRWARGLATGCALGALDLFSVRFDSVFFLSQFLYIVREPGS